MSFLRKVTAKPWEHAGEMEGLHGGYSAGTSASRTGLYMFLAVITSMFLLFSISYQLRASFPDWMAITEPGILWFNTGVLLLTSVCLQLAVNASRAAAANTMRNYLFVGAILTLVFLAGQLMAWAQLMEAGFYARANPANAFFYLLTGIHGLHLIAGLWFLGGAAKKAVKSPDDAALPLRISLCATYWHYLLLVWALLFYLLLNS
jgi:cytochrome c oxidase subunit 3